MHCDLQCSGACNSTFIHSMFLVKQRSFNNDNNKNKVAYNNFSLSNTSLIFILNFISDSAKKSKISLYSFAKVHNLYIKKKF